MYMDILIKRKIDKNYFELCALAKCALNMHEVLNKNNTKIINTCLVTSSPDSKDESFHK